MVMMLAKITLQCVVVVVLVLVMMMLMRRRSCELVQLLWIM